MVFIMAADSSASIDRKALVSRHNITSTKIDALSPLSVGNGKFAFTADITGLQTFPQAYENGIPLTTMAQWGWHSFKNAKGCKESDTFVDINTAGRKVPYQIVQNSDAASYFRANPHQTNLARIGFVLKKSDGSLASANDISNINQQLDLWTGILTSSFKLESKKINVKTFCHPDIDQISFEIESDLISENRLAVEIAFPYANGNWGKDPADWNSPDKHITKIKKINKSAVEILHDMDSLIYNCKISFTTPAKIQETRKHHYVLTTVSNKWQCSIAFGKKIKEIDNFDSAIIKTIAHWKNFWLTGGVIDLSQSADPRWQELERRIVLSQYLTAIQSAQKYPPAETGLTTASWFGKFHLEMHWWHHVHFALWNRTEKFIPSLQWYKEILPQAQKTAKKQGYDGARWPKMTDPTGRNSPSSIGSLLIWQQPHPIYYAELLYAQNSSSQILREYKDIVFETAKFMASYPTWNEKDKCFDLGPPLISAREHGTKTFELNKNPTFELAYWRWALLTANKWKQRLKLEPELKWANIADHLTPWPTENNIYIEQQFPIVDEGEHPCMLGAYGILPESPQLNKKTMEKTLEYVLTKWTWQDTWGWDFPMMAMTAARLGRGDLAIDSLLYDTPKNTYLLNGHNYQRENLPCYLPGNGGLLTAVAMMAAGWDNCSDHNAPGFPNDGKWIVKWENLNKMP